MDMCKALKIGVICLLICGIGVGFAIDICNTVTETEKLKTERFILYLKENNARFDIGNLQNVCNILEEQKEDLCSQEQDAEAFWVGYKEAEQSLIYLRLYKFLENNDDLEAQYARIVQEIKDYYDSDFKQFTNMYTDDYLMQPIDNIIKTIDNKEEAVKKVYDILEKYALSFEGQTYLP